MSKIVRLVLGGLPVLWMIAGFTPLAVAGDSENPFRNARVGDYVKHRSTSETNGSKVSLTTTQTVKAKTATEVTLLVESDMPGHAIPGKDVTVQLNRPYDPAHTTSDGKPVQAEKLEEGDETISVGGRQYSCHWTKNRIHNPAAGKSHMVVAKMWICKDVPLNGIVKMESDAEMAMGGKVVKTRTTMELVDFRGRP